MFTAGTIILILKIAVILVTVLLLCSLLAVARGRYRLHGRINLVFFLLTMVALLGLEVVARLINPHMFREHFERTESWPCLMVHLCFSMPAAGVLPLMLFTGFRHWRRLHLSLAVLFGVLWTGTVITGIFFLPHTNP